MGSALGREGRKDHGGSDREPRNGSRLLGHCLLCVAISLATSMKYEKDWCKVMV